METQLTLTRTPASIKFLHGSFLLLTILANICDVEKNSSDHVCSNKSGNLSRCRLSNTFRLKSIRMENVQPAFNPPVDIDSSACHSPFKLFNSDDLHLCFFVNFCIIKMV